MYRKTAENTANQSLKLNGSWKRISKIGEKNFHLEYSTGKIALPSSFKTFPRCPFGNFPYLRICAPAACPAGARQNQINKECLTFPKYPRSPASKQLSTISLSKKVQLKRLAGIYFGENTFEKLPKKKAGLSCKLKPS